MRMGPANEMRRLGRREAGRLLRVFGRIREGRGDDGASCLVPGTRGGR